VASARLREPPLDRDYVCITATAEDFTSTLLTRAGQCLAVSLIMTGIAFATGPVANADLKSLLACIYEGTKMGVFVHPSE
jgi:predicted NodU family carbamoyl transferase